MPKPMPGAPYTIVQGDTLSHIALAAYGQASKWRDIYAANQTVLRSGDPNLIFPGEIINIPVDNVVEDLVTDLRELALPSLEGKEKDDFTIVVEGTEIPIESGRAKRIMDTAADGWTAVIKWEPTETKLAKALMPYQYPKAECYLGGKLVVGGTLYVVNPIITPEGRRINLTGYSSTADAIDSTIKPPYEYTNIKLQDLIESLLRPLGIALEFDDLLLLDTPFDKVTAKPEDTIIEFISKLAAQRKWLVSSTEEGKLLITKANTTGEPVGTIQEEGPPYQNIQATFDGRKRFNAYKAIGQSPARKNKTQKQAKTAVAKDEQIPKSRFLTFKTDETTTGNIQDAADWKRSKQLAEALTIPFPVSSWYDPNGNLWKENKIVTVESETIFVPKGFEFLIREVEYIYGHQGTPAILGLVPPQVYTGEKLVEPWGSAELSLMNKIANEVGL